jgi:hypothetical protein
MVQFYGSRQNEAVKKRGRARMVDEKMAGEDGADFLVGVRQLVSKEACAGSATTHEWLGTEAKGIFCTSICKL